MRDWKNSWEKSHKIYYISYNQLTDCTREMCSSTCHVHILYANSVHYLHLNWINESEWAREFPITYWAASGVQQFRMTAVQNRVPATRILVHHAIAIAMPSDLFRPNGKMAINYVAHRKIVTQTYIVACKLRTFWLSGVRVRNTIDMHLFGYWSALMKWWSRPENASRSTHTHTLYCAKLSKSDETVYGWREGKKTMWINCADKLARTFVKSKWNCAVVLVATVTCRHMPS